MNTQERIEIRELTVAELEVVNGGMKYDRNHVSSNVIDARGGQFETWYGTITLDVNGNVSSITR